MRLAVGAFFLLAALVVALGVEDAVQEKLGPPAPPVFDPQADQNNFNAALANQGFEIPDSWFKCSPEDDPMHEWIKHTGDIISASAKNIASNQNGTFLSVDTSVDANEIRSDKVEHKALITETTTGKDCRITRSMGTGEYEINDGNKIKLEYVKFGVCKQREPRADGKTPCTDDPISLVTLAAGLSTAVNSGSIAVSNALSAGAGGRRLLDLGTVSGTTQDAVTLIRRRRRRRRTPTKKPTKAPTQARRRRRRRRRTPTKAPTKAPTSTHRRRAPSLWVADLTATVLALSPTKAPTKAPTQKRCEVVECVSCCATYSWIGSCNFIFGDETPTKLCSEVTDLSLKKALNTVAASFV